MVFLPINYYQRAYQLEKERVGSFVALIKIWRGARVAEEARLESVYTLTRYRGFESLSLRRRCSKAFLV